MIRLLLILCCLTFTVAERVRRQEVPEPIFPFPEESTTRGENLTVEIWTVDPFENSTDIWNATEFADYNSTEFWSNSTDMYEFTTIEEESNSTWFSISTESPNLNSTEIFEWTTLAENSTNHYESALTTDQDNSTEFYTEKTDYYGTSTTENILDSAPATTFSPDSTDQTATEPESTKYSTVVFETGTEENQNSTEHLVFTETVFWTENLNSTESNTVAVTENLTSLEMSTAHLDVTTEADLTLATEEFSTIFENSTADEWLSLSTESSFTESSTNLLETSSSLMTTEFDSLQANYTEEIMLTTENPTALFSSTIFEGFTTVELKTFESTTDNVAENSTAMMTSADEPITESHVFQSTEILSSFAPFTENAETTYSAMNSTSDELFSFPTIDQTTDEVTDITVTENSMTTRNEASLTSFAATENPTTNAGTNWTPNENTTEYDTRTTANLISEESTVTGMSFTSNTVESTSELYFTTDLISTENPNQSTSSEGFSTSPTVSPIIFSTIADTTAASETATINFFTSEADLTSETNSLPITSALSFSSAGISTTEMSSTSLSEGITTEISTDGSTAPVFSTTLEFSTPSVLTSQASSSSLSSGETSDPPTTFILTTTAVESTTISSATPTVTSEGTTTASASATPIVTTTTASATTTMATTTEETTTTASSTTVQETTSTTSILTTLPEEQAYTVDDRISLASNSWQDEYSDLSSIKSQALIPDVIHDLDLILAQNGDLTKIEISVDSLEEMTVRSGGTTVNFRVTASVAGTEDDFINSYNDNFNTFSDYQSLKIITRTDIDSKQDITNDNFVSNNNNNTLSTETIIIIAVSIAAFILIVVIVISVCCYCRHKRQKEGMKNDRLSTLDRGPIEDGYFYRIENGIRISTPTERLI